MLQNRTSSLNNRLSSFSGQVISTALSTGLGTTQMCKHFYGREDTFPIILGWCWPVPHRVIPYKGYS